MLLDVIMIIVIVVGGLAGLAATLMQVDITSPAAREKDEKEKAFQSIRPMMAEKLTQGGFIISKEMETNRAVLYADNANNKWAVYQAETLNIAGPFGYSDLENAEIYENATCIQRMDIPGANAETAEHKMGKCTRLEIRIVINSLEHPLITIVLIDQKTSRSSEAYQRIKAQATDLLATLTYMKLHA